MCLVRPCGRSRRCRCQRMRRALIQRRCGFSWIAFKRDLGDRVGMVAALHNLGDAAFHLGSYLEAAALLEESVASSRALGATHRGAQSLHGLGMARLRLGQTTRAIEDLRRGLSLFREMGDDWGVALCLEGLAQAAPLTRRNPLAVRLLGAAAAWRTANGTPLPPSDRADYDRALDSARAILGSDAFSSAWLDGSVLTLLQAADEALRLEAEAPTRSSVDANGEVEASLSPREREVAALVARGLTNRQIADGLGISKTTVDRHVSNILVKRGFASRAQLAAWVARHEPL
jgi:DNA-binding CsgD family transcriptional regulator